MLSTFLQIFMMTEIKFILKILNQKFCQKFCWLENFEDGRELATELGSLDSKRWIDCKGGSERIWLQVFPTMHLYKMNSHS